MSKGTNPEIDLETEDGTAAEDAYVRAVQADIEAGISVYDAQFQRQQEQFGERFVHEYLSEVATHMAVHIVRAFELHDRKQYHRCGRAFGTVYTFLFPVPAADAHAAGAGYALALKYHDVIEDGIKSVARGEPITAGYTDGELPPRVQDILTHPYWNAVLFGFELLVDALELPHGYAEAQTEFFRYHTAAHEAQDHTGGFEPSLEEIAMDYAALAQRCKFGTLVADPAVVTAVTDQYLAAVRAHDAHTPADQDANIGRMITVYDRILATIVGVDPLADRLAARQ